MKIVHIEGKEHLESALRKGKGVITFGAHIGNFVLLGTDGHQFHTLFRIPNDNRIQKLIATFLPNYHQSVIPSRPARSAVTKVLAALKRNEIVYIQWNWLTVRLNKHHLDRNPDLNVSDSSDLDLLPEDRKKDESSINGKKDCVTLVSQSYEESFSRQGPIPSSATKRLARVVTSFDLVPSLLITVFKFLTIRFLSVGFS